MDLSRITGGVAEANNWINLSQLTTSKKKLLLQFTERFSDFTFFRDDEKVLRSIEQAQSLTLPKWFYEQRKIFGFVLPQVKIQFDDFDYLNPQSDDVEASWYVLSGSWGFGDDEMRNMMLNKAHFLPIGIELMDPASMLAIKMDDDKDQRIYIFHYQDLMDNDLDGIEVSASVYPAFESYAKMLSRIIRLEK